MNHSFHSNRFFLHHAKLLLLPVLVLCCCLLQCHWTLGFIPPSCPHPCSCRSSTSTTATSSPQRKWRRMPTVASNSGERIISQKMLLSSIRADDNDDDLDASNSVTTTTSSGSCCAGNNRSSSSYINTTLTFPPISLNDLMALSPGQSVTSCETLTLGIHNNNINDVIEWFDFQVQIYPRGGAAGMSRAAAAVASSGTTTPTTTGAPKLTGWLPWQHQQQQGSLSRKLKKQGFGMAYAMQPPAATTSWRFPSSADNDETSTVDVYLQFLPRTPHQWIDASFALRLIGNQQPPLPPQPGVIQKTQTANNSNSANVVAATRTGATTTSTRRRFDIEWRSGIRFVPLSYCDVAQGQAPDFGSRFLQTKLLPTFLGIDTLPSTEVNNSIRTTKTMHDELNGAAVTTTPTTTTTSDLILKVQVEIQVHRDDSGMHCGDDSTELLGPPPPTLSKQNPMMRQWWSPIQDIRTISPQRNGISNNGGDGDVDPAVTTTTTTTTTSNLQQRRHHNTDLVRVGRVVVPVLRRLAERPQMFANGVYPGVEYRIVRIHDNNSNDKDIVDYFYSRPDAYYDLRPMYPLVPQLERSWPVTVNERDIPVLFTPTQYNTVSAIGSLLTAITSIVVAYLLSQAISLYYIPSRSMEPTLQVGDVLLVEKITPRWAQLVQQSATTTTTTAVSSYHVDDIVLFTPPTALQEMVMQSGGRISPRDLFVKRIAAQAGDTMTVSKQSGNVKINGENPRTVRRDLCDAEPLGLLQRYLGTATSNGETITTPKGTVQVLGDCASVSIDSRIWGPLPMDNIVGRPLLRVWPISKFGPISSQPHLVQDWED